MSDKRDKPADEDPDATITGFRGLKPPKPDDDATVMMPSRKALEEPKADDDATVMMTRDALKNPEADPESTVMMTRDALKEPDEDATVTFGPGALKAAEAAAETAAAKGSPATPPAAFRSASDPDATASGTRLEASTVIQEPSRMPMIAGGIVVVLVILYFVMTGNKSPAPEAPKPEAAATAPAPAAPAASPSASSPSAAPTAAPAASAAPAAPAEPAAAPASAAPAASTASAGAPKVQDRLAGEIKRGLVAVTEDGGATMIAIRSTHQFASGGVDPEGNLRALLQTIAVALDKVPGSIVVTGHADAKPSSNPKFPSNQELSAARAESAAKVMAAKLSDPKRITSEGASDSKPLAPSDTAENRAKNRRVTIEVKP